MDWAAWQWDRAILENPWTQKLLQLTRALIEHSRGCDLLIHEAYSMMAYRNIERPTREFRHRHHTSSEQLAEIANGTNAFNLNFHRFVLKAKLDDAKQLLAVAEQELETGMGGLLNDRGDAQEATRLTREFDNLRMMRDYGLTGYPHHVARPLGRNYSINALLVTENCEGELLSDVILSAIQTGDNGRLFYKLTALAYFLSTLHNRTAIGVGADFHHEDAPYWKGQPKYDSCPIDLSSQQRGRPADRPGMRTGGTGREAARRSAPAGRSRRSRAACPQLSGVWAP